MQYYNRGTFIDHFKGRDKCRGYNTVKKKMIVALTLNSICSCCRRLKMCCVLSFPAGDLGNVNYDD